MTDIAIRVSNLSKCYQIYNAPRDRLKQFVVPKLCRAIPPLRRFFSTLHSPLPTYYREFWALKDVSFEIKKGETVGIIGRNGSGKSTLLQMICGTLNPNSGSIQTNGRIAALLELGSGFNPEFTGRENVYMNASVLGLSNEEIDARFNDIVAFADIGDFIEQPVKTYSSGMMVRLAFAVIAHVDADILVVDEALAVGDAVFTQKCMRFMRKFMEQGTVLFVSHDSGSVLNLCQRAIWLNKGIVAQVGTAKEVVESYTKFTMQEIYGDEAKLKDNLSTTNSIVATKTPADEIPLEAAVIDYGSELTIKDNFFAASGWKTGAAEIMAVSFNKFSAEQALVFEGGERIRVVIHAKANEALGSPILGFLVRDRLGQNLFGENTFASGSNPLNCVEAGSEFTGEFVFQLPMLPNGEYAVVACLADGDIHNNVQHHWLHDALIINVCSSKVRWGLVGIKFESVAIEVKK